MRELTVKTKFLYVLPEPFTLDLAYTDRQRIVIAADDDVAKERQSRARSSEQARRLPADRERPPASGDGSEVAVVKAVGAAAAQRLQRGLHGLQDAGTGLKRGFDDRAMLTLRRRLGILMIGRAESSVLRFDQGHPLANVLYVGHPAKPDLYFPAAASSRSTTTPSGGWMRSSRAWPIEFPAAQEWPMSTWRKSSARR